MEKESNSTKIFKIDFFVVGAAKSGTTLLWSYLRNNSYISLPEDPLYKEPAIFSSKKGKVSLKKYFSLLDHCKITGDFSTAYLSDPISAKKIYKHNPDAKIIILLRDPVFRAQSLYNWMTMEGYEYISSFEKALRIEPRRWKNPSPLMIENNYNYYYFSSGLYYEQVKRYTDLFKNVLFIKFSDLVKNPQEKYVVVCKFLNIKPGKIISRKSNVSKKVISPKLQYCLRIISIFGNKLVPSFKKTERDQLLSLGIREEPPEKLPEKTEKILRQKYRSDINKLEKLTELDLEDWK